MYVGLIDRGVHGICPEASVSTFQIRRYDVDESWNRVIHGEEKKAVRIATLCDKFPELEQHRAEQ